MNPEAVFKAYDVRGRTDTGDLDEEIYERAGHALVALVGSESIAVGYDCRATSPGFFDALASGINLGGCDVIDLGEVPTDAVYYYSGAHDVPGAMITASHNPAEYNGLKLCREGAAPIGSDTGLDQIKESVIARRELARAARPGSIRRDDPVAGYVNHLFEIVPPDSIGPLRIAVDGGNGMAGVAVERVFDRIAASLTGLYLEPDGTFPNHPADPLVPENLEDLRNLMAGESFDIGVAFDGDADRAFFLDDEGVPLSGSTVTSLIARRLLVDNPGDAVVHNLITSRAVAEIVRENGGTPVRTRVGHSFIKAVMAETGAVFGGEHSGHYYFRENFRADSGMLAMLVLLAVMSEDGRPLSVIRHEVERYSASGEINFSVADKDRALDTIEGAFPGAGIDRLDGLTVDLGDAWFNLRPSNTEPLLRLNVEASSPDAVDRLVDAVRETVEEL